jgi:hypothetical protein
MILRTFLAKVEDEVNLRPMASRPVCILPTGARDQSFVLCLTIVDFFIWGALSDERRGL